MKIYHSKSDILLAEVIKKTTIKKRAKSENVNLMLEYQIECKIIIFLYLMH